MMMIDTETTMNKFLDAMALLVSKSLTDFSNGFQVRCFENGNHVSSSGLLSMLQSA
jgi:hypothetical protein